MKIVVHCPQVTSELTFNCRNGISYSLWDKWNIKGNKDFTIQQFITALQEKYKVEASMIVQGREDDLRPHYAWTQEEAAAPVSTSPPLMQLLLVRLEST